MSGTRPKNHRWIVVDYGGVLTNPISETINLFCRRTGIAASDLMAAMRESGAGGETGMALLERGEVSEHQFLLRLNRRLFPNAEDYLTDQEFHEDWFKGRWANIELLRYLATIHAKGVSLALLTNNVQEWRPYWMQTLSGYVDMFSTIIDSSSVQTRKPEEEIYRILLDNINAPASDCLFIDDDLKNIEAAERLDFGVHLFQSNVETIARIRSFLD